VDALGGEQLRQPLAGVEHSRLDGFFVRCRWISAHIIDRFFMVVDEVDDFAMRGRQFCQAVE